MIRVRKSPDQVHDLQGKSFLDPRSATTGAASWPTDPDRARSGSGGQPLYLTRRGQGRLDGFR